MQVLKFGGSSVANADNINKVVEIVLEAIKREPVILVVSALGGVTDQLILTGTQAAAGNEEYKQQQVDVAGDLLVVDEATVVDVMLTKRRPIQGITHGGMGKVII